MNYRKTAGGSAAAIGILILAQITSQMLASGLMLLKISVSICNILGGVLYFGLAFVGIKILINRGFELKELDFRIPKFSIKGKWILIALLLSIAVKGIYLLTAPGKYVSSGMSWEQMLQTLSAGIFFTGIAAGFVEELVFRGVILHLVEKTWNRKAAVLLPSVMFGLVHIMGRKFSLGSCLLVVLSGTMVGVMFSMVTIESGSIWNSGIVHAVWNIVIIGGGLSVGEVVDEHSVMTYVLDTKSFVFTGGEFGIESSVVALAGYFIVTAIAVWYTGRRKLGFGR